MVDAGIGAVNIKAVAERAGVQRSTVYNHWAGRTELVLAAIRHSVAQHMSAHDMLEPVDDLEPIRAIVRTVGRNLGTDWGVIAASLACTAEHDEELAVAHRMFVQAARENLAGLIAEQVGAGTLRAGIDPDWAVGVLIGPLYYERLVMHRGLTDTELEAHIATTMAVLSPPPPTEP